MAATRQLNEKKNGCNNIRLIYETLHARRNKKQAWIFFRYDQYSVRFSNRVAWYGLRCLRMPNSRQYHLRALADCTEPSPKRLPEQEISTLLLHVSSENVIRRKLLHPQQSEKTPHIELENSNCFVYALGDLVYRKVVSFHQKCLLIHFYATAFQILFSTNPASR
jgi:hypothetical protein